MSQVIKWNGKVVSMEEAMRLFAEFMRKVREEKKGCSTATPRTP